MGTTSQATQPLSMRGQRWTALIRESEHATPFILPLGLVKPYTQETLPVTSKRTYCCLSNLFLSLPLVERETWGTLFF